ncbi:sarcosine oxidase subunit alpha [Devosia sp. YR412]|uniref:FAD-dependent oxidoreductase n=1 Tax=Devosia sp. YR412 TaxID=1881030 RepID=UPI0008D6EBFA|nr:FAD-dependent oxidoreductase [Devosia sp. YR412]SEP76526.1 sarcosine oxidase subunit alpha [Devosia sp. YR412]
MKLHSARLGTGHLLSGSAIDRSRPIQFRLDRRVIHGFAGDTVLSAVLASGIDTAGHRDGQPIALTSRHAPSIAPSVQAKDPHAALPMERTQAHDGADYVTLAPRLKRNLPTRLLKRDSHSLHLDLGASDALTRPWLGRPGDPGPTGDLVVIGGGVAGMSAALAGTKNGLRVLLLEASTRLGGHARLFGTMEGEETPDAAITRLTQAVAASSKITTLTSAEVFALRPGKLRLHQVELLDGVPRGRVLDVTAPHIILATGAFERLPVFSGNRMPGVIGSLEAFDLAQLYGIWPGQSAVLATSSSPAYRLALMARDAGITLQRILDSRPQPQSRFIEFAKAYGITQAAGTITGSVAPAPKTRRLTVTPQLALDGFSSAETSIETDRLIASGGWQPDLTLWHMAGGESLWKAASARLEPTTAPPGIALAGSAAGWLTRAACLASGTQAVQHRLGKETKPVVDTLIDPLYETPDAAAPIGTPPDETSQPAYLDGGRGYLARPRHLPSRWPNWLPFATRPEVWSLADTPHPLDIAEIAAGVQLGILPATSAGIVAQERVAMVGVDVEELAPPDKSPLPLPPPYLLGRYANASLFVVAPSEQRLLSPGSLIHIDPDSADPLNAIGVVVRIMDGAAIALVIGTTGQTASLREPGRVIPIRLVAAYSEGMDLAAALGGSASPL